MQPRLLVAGAFCALAVAQDTTAVLEGQITDPSGRSVAAAIVEASNPVNGYSRKHLSGADGAYHLVLPPGSCELAVTAPGFAPCRLHAVSVSVSRNLRLDVQLQIARKRDAVDVVAEAPLVESSNAIGDVVTGRQLVDLPLNGRNFTQLGLLQPGVAPMTQGLLIAGGSLRAGQHTPSTGCGPSRTTTSWMARRT